MYGIFGAIPPSPHILFFLFMISTSLEIRFLYVKYFSTVYSNNQFRRRSARWMHEFPLWLFKTIRFDMKQNRSPHCDIQNQNNKTNKLKVTDLAVFVDNLLNCGTKLELLLPMKISSSTNDFTQFYTNYFTTNHNYCMFHFKVFCVLNETRQEQVINLSPLYSHSKFKRSVDCKFSPV